MLPACGTIVGFLVAAVCIQSARKSDKNSVRPLFCDRAKVAILVIISSHIRDSDDALTTGWGVLPMKWCTRKKMKCATEVGCDEYRTSLCESFSMCDHVTFKVWNTKTKRWEL